MVENVGKFQKLNKDLFVLKADKGNITVEANRANYNEFGIVVKL